MNSTLTRRRKLALSMTAALALVLSACSTGNTMNMNMNHSSMGGASQAAGDSSTNGQPDEAVSSGGKLAVTLTAAETMVPYGGKMRWAMTYNDKVNGPTLRVRPGDHVEVTVVNHLKQATSLHTHGLHVSPTQDDPFSMVEPGDSYTYRYDIPADQPAGTFWYHPHIHGKTAEQVASGLSGAILVENADDDTLAAVSTSRVLEITDPPLVTANPWVDANGASASPSTGLDGMGGMDGMQGMDGMGSTSSGVDMMTAMLGRTGPRLLTNGANGVDLTGASGKLERIHLVNATASARLRVTFSGSAMVLLSSEGGRLAKAAQVSELVLDGAGRAELVLVPGPDGGTLSAQRLSNEEGGAPLGSPFKIASVASDAGTDLSGIPGTFAHADTRSLFAGGVKVAKKRVITLAGHMNPTIDGSRFDPSVVNYTAKKGTVEEWVIKNTTPMFHPMHLHTWRFQVKGETGWQDVVTIPPYSEQVVRIAFDDFAGTTVLHCHILDHEDNGMMAVIRVA